MKRILSALGTIVVVGAIVSVGALKWWNVFGMKKMGHECSSRLGCRSYYCLAHARRGPAGSDEKVPGYCTDKCESDGDCEAGLRCVVPTQAALDDLPALGRPKKLCERVE